MRCLLMARPPRCPQATLGRCPERLAKAGRRHLLEPWPECNRVLTTVAGATGVSCRGEPRSTDGGGAPARSGPTHGGSAVSKVAILGAGVMGSALAVPLSDNGHAVRLGGTFPDRPITAAAAAGEPHPGLGRRLPGGVEALQLEALPSAIGDADIVVSGVNSPGVRWAAEQLAPLLRPHHRVLAIAKGMDLDDTGALRILPDVLA